ncbi:MAG TPA: tRNA (adenosine(37)-N6)-threonylcarbamoyltransferase complex transferase subunit TsaD [Luteibaculaceae bacterium]|nr:tRNA (adenosine(37)-N6)-threonylcarbamoyltransferase complex transferase subunit TsaD [Luteibaculaceae bacterium]
MNKRNEDLIILGIESSCDDTSAAVLKNHTILSNRSAGQKVHEQYGGVVPELASRAHQQHMVPVVHAALSDAGVGLNEVDAIAVTAGPGLLGSLLVGVNFAKSLALATGKPLLSVNHMEGHILAHLIENNQYPVALRFPFLCLTVSGGHTQLVRVDSPLEMTVIGETIDDAAGEAFDKAAKILGLPYPGGPLVDKYGREGNPLTYSFPEPKMPDLQFSFSGLKTSFLYFVEKQRAADPLFAEKERNNLCASIQHAIVGFLLKKVRLAAQQEGIKQIAIAGGVSANSYLRDSLSAMALREGWDVFLPRFEYCTDNAAMIAMAGLYQYKKGVFAGQDLAPTARMKI